MLLDGTGALGADDLATGERTAVVAAVRVRAEAVGSLRRPRLEPEGPRDRQQRESQKSQLPSHDVPLLKWVALPSAPCFKGVSAAAEAATPPPTGAPAAWPHTRPGR